MNLEPRFGGPFEDRDGLPLRPSHVWLRLRIRSRCILLERVGLLRDHIGLCDLDGMILCVNRTFRGGRSLALRLDLERERVLRWRGRGV